MTKHFILKLKFLVLFSALVFPGLFPIMLSGRSSGAWTAASQCGTKAFISVSSRYTTAPITSTEGLYLGGNKDGKIVQPEGINNDVYTIAKGKFTGSTVWQILLPTFQRKRGLVLQIKIYLVMSYRLTMSLPF